MIGAMNRYTEIRWALLLERAIATAPLTMEREAEYAAELDRCWNELTDEEQSTLEREIADEPVPNAPAELSLLDAPLEVGTSDQPRRAA
jgi:hypothetical protein